MKKIFLTIATAALFSVSVFAADGGKKADGSTNVTNVVLQEFTSDFATAQNVTWTVTRNCQKADFVINGVKKTAFYNLAGDFLGTTENIAYAALPAKTQKQIAEGYKGYVAGDVIVYFANTNLNDVVEPISYFVDLKKDSKEVLVRVSQAGDVEFFKEVK